MQNETRAQCWYFCFKNIGISIILSSAVFFSVVSTSWALSITADFIPHGTLIPGTNRIAENAPLFTVGGGNLLGVIEGAAKVWEIALSDPHDLTLHIAWSSGGILGNGADGFFTRIQSDPLTGRITEGSIVFDTGRMDSCMTPPCSTGWFLDPSPLRNESFTSFTETFADLGGGIINTSRFAFGVPGTNRLPVATPFGTQGRDLLTLALHEIGHGLNIGSGNFLNIDNRDTMIDGEISISSPRPFAGTIIPYTFTGGGHIEQSALLPPLLTTNSGFSTHGAHRIYPSAADILTVAELSGFQDLSLNPLNVLSRIPVPSTLPLFLIGAIVLIICVRQSPMNINL